jgi:hypothetical protein
VAPVQTTTPSQLDYRPRPTRASRAAAWLRGGLLVAAVLLFQLVVILLFHPLVEYSELQFYLGGGIIGTPAAPVTYTGTYQQTPGPGEFSRIVYAIQASTYLLLLLLSQWLFLRQRGTWRLDTVGGARLTRTSALIAGLIVMLVTVGLLPTLMEIPDLWRAVTLADPSGAIDTSDFRQQLGVVWVVMLFVWVTWAGIFWNYGRNLDRYTFTGKVIRKLLAGTFVELFIAATAHAWVVRTRGSDCYCTRGSYTGIVFGMTALVWLFGPGVWFFVQRERRRRETLVVPDASRASSP